MTARTPPEDVAPEDRWLWHWQNSRLQAVNGGRGFPTAAQTARSAARSEADRAAWLDRVWDLRRPG